MTQLGDITSTEKLLNVIRGLPEVIAVIGLWIPEAVGLVGHHVVGWC